MFDRWQRPAPLETLVLDQVPPSEVARVLKDFICDDARGVKAEKESDGTWTITVVIPRC